MRYGLYFYFKIEELENSIKYTNLLNKKFEKFFFEKYKKISNKNLLSIFGNNDRLKRYLKKDNLLDMKNLIKDEVWFRFSFENGSSLVDNLVQIGNDGTFYISLDFGGDFFENKYKNNMRQSYFSKYLKEQAIKLVEDSFEEIKFLGVLGLSHDGYSFKKLKKAKKEDLVFRFLNKDGKLEFTDGLLPFGD